MIWDSFNDFVSVFNGGRSVEILDLSEIFSHFLFLPLSEFQVFFKYYALFIDNSGMPVIEKKITN